MKLRVSHEFVLWWGLYEGGPARPFNDGGTTYYRVKRINWERATAHAILTLEASC